MSEHARFASDYSATQFHAVWATCLYIARVLGSFMDELVIVGGLVPFLLINHEHLPEGAEPHPGTLDLDLGLTMALFDEQRYTGLIERLRASGFRPDVNERGNPTPQRWVLEKPVKVTIDFLIAPHSARSHAIVVLKHIAEHAHSGLRRRLVQKRGQTGGHFRDALP